MGLGVGLAFFSTSGFLPSTSGFLQPSTSGFLQPSMSGFLQSSTWGFLTSSAFLLSSTGSPAVLPCSFAGDKFASSPADSARLGITSLSSSARNFFSKLLARGDMSNGNVSCMGSSVVGAGTSLCKGRATIIVARRLSISCLSSTSYSTTRKGRVLLNHSQATAGTSTAQVAWPSPLPYQTPLQALASQASGNH